jgi:hypothetical protein
LLHNLPPWFGPTLLVGLCAAAFLKGGVEERLAAASLLANVALTLIMRDTRWPHVQWTGFALDVLLTAVLLAVALRTPKFWPLPAAAFQLLATLTHVATLVDRKVNPWAYLTAIVIWTYALMITLAVGVWNHWRAGRQLAETGR